MHIKRIEVGILSALSAVVVVDGIVLTNLDRMRAGESGGYEILIGVILGPLLETYFLRAMKMSQGDIMVIFSSSLGNVLWVFLFISIGIPYYMDWRRARQKEREA